MRTLLFSLVLSSYIQVVQAQITVTSITLTGNLKTQNDIILREISFEKNKSYSNDDLTKRIKQTAFEVYKLFFYLL